jgi:hypothetical protein
LVAGNHLHLVPDKNITKQSEGLSPGETKQKKKQKATQTIKIWEIT